MLQSQRFDDKDRARQLQNEDDKLSQDGIRNLSKRLYVLKDKQDEEPAAEMDEIRA